MGRNTGDEFVVWVESANLSMVERRLGNLERAEELALQALVIDAARKDEMSIAWTINSVAAVAAAKGDDERAATLRRPPSTPCTAWSAGDWASPRHQAGHVALHQGWDPNQSPLAAV